MNIKGVNFVVNDDGEKQAVIIDLRKNRQLWEDFYDTAIVEARRNEPRETLAEVKQKLLKRNGK